MAQPRQLGVLTAASLGAAAAAALACAAVLGQGVGPLCSGGCLDRRLAALTVAGGALPPDRIDRARDLARRQLRSSPFDDSAWLRLAALETQAGGGRLTPAAARALDASYRYAPVDAEVALWRTGFVFGHWRDASAQARRGAQREVSVLFSQDPAAFRALQGDIADPAGALAFRLLLAQLGAGDDLEG